MIMIRIFLVFYFLSLKTLASAPSSANTSNQEFNLRAFYKIASFNTMAEVKYRSNEKRTDETFYTFGGRFRLFQNLKVGAFYQLAKGARHDEDWVLQNNRWTWRNTEQRQEDNIIVEITPKFLLDFLPGERWVFNFRVSGKQNLFNDNKTLLTRPGLSFYWFKNGSPYMNFYLQHEIYFPLNYGRDTIYQRWTYLGMMYHFNKTVKVSPFLSFGFEKWSHTDDFQQRTGQTYNIKENFNNIGVSLIFIL